MEKVQIVPNVNSGKSLTVGKGYEKQSGVQLSFTPHVHLFFGLAGIMLEILS